MQTETTVSKEEVKSKLKDIIINDLDANIEAGQVLDDISLYEDGVGLDSISIVNLIVMLEKKFGFTFEENELNATMFGSINNLTDFIYKKIN
jgi:acyl carrier protein